MAGTLSDPPASEAGKSKGSSLGGLGAAAAGSEAGQTGEGRASESEGLAGRGRGRGGVATSLAGGGGEVYYSKGSAMPIIQEQVSASDSWGGGCEWCWDS